MNKVLIIESDEDTRYLYQIALQFQHFEISTAESAREGLSLIKQSVPDLILLDSTVADLADLNFVDEVRKITPKKMPIIILTDLRDGAAEQEAAVYGACEYLDKEMPVGELITKVRKVIKD
jgi:DNA-binding response OmpR family regulator